MKKCYQKNTVLVIVIICIVCLLSGCGKKKAVEHNKANTKTITSKIAKEAKVAKVAKAPKTKSDSKIISKASDNPSTNPVSTTKDAKINAVPRTKVKVDYKKLLPANYNWNIIKTADVNLGTSFTIVAACSDRSSTPMTGQFFVFSQENKLLWKSSQFETSSILDEKIYVLKLNNKALIYGEYVWGGARGMMHGGTAFSIDSQNGIKGLNKDILVGLYGEIDITGNSIAIEGDCIHGKLALSMPDGIYKEQLINGTTKVFGVNRNNTINDIEHWNHPVKKLLNSYGSYGIEIEKVELLKNKTYPIFHLGYTSGLLNNCYYPDLYNIAEANEFWNYKLCSDDNLDEIESVDVFCDRNKRRLLEAVICPRGQAGKKSVKINLTDKYIVNTNNKNTLTDNDFKVKINKFEVHKQSKPADIIKRLGRGDAEICNNGYVGIAPDGCTIHEYGYPKLNPNYSIVTLDDKEVARIDMKSTIKGLHVGDTYKKMIQLYGKPNLEILRNKLRDSEYVYSYKDMQFVVRIYKKKVDKISIQYKNLYRF